MGLTFNEKWYRTINDVTEELKTGQGTIKKLVAKGELSPWKDEMQGTRKFRHFDDAWMEEARTYFDKLRNK